jgi:uncharacterized membrane protein YcaP (DUF421 family)
MLALVLRVGIAYVYLLVLLRLTGKRTIKEGTPFDFVVALMLGDLPDDLIWGEVPVASGLVAAGTIVLLHTAVTYASYRSVRVDRLLGSGPTAVIRGGGVVQDGLRREHLNEADLDAYLRSHGIGRREAVRDAFVESSGDLGLVRQPRSRPADRRDLPRLEHQLR